MARPLERWRAIARSEPVTITLLVGANLVLLFGVLFLGWDVFRVLFLYWIENGVVGVINVPKIVLAARNPQSNEMSGSAAARSIFFLFHYGLFWVVHGGFIFLLAGRLGSGLSLGDPVLLLAMASLAASHAAAFWSNYVGQRQYLRTTPQKQQMQPYPRMAVLHFSILLGGFAIAILGAPAVFVALLVVGKTVLDLGLHFADRARTHSAAGSGAPA